MSVHESAVSAWPPAIDPDAAAPFFEGRTATWYRHGTQPAWGYAQPQTDRFLVVHPARATSRPPLYVILHSAGHGAASAFDTLQRGEDDPKSHHLYRPPADALALFLDCRTNKDQNDNHDWWWGGPLPAYWQQKDPAIYHQLARNGGSSFTPVERRVEDTVRWAIDAFDADPQRVFLAGISMGGSGALGIGLRRGDLFAAIVVNVPAGVAHAAQRMFFPPSHVPPSLNIPDPPVVVAYSSPTDSWSADQAHLLDPMRQRRYAFIDTWGPSGHSARRQTIEQACDLAFAFPWLSIRKNQAYPVFTDASSDDPDPWRCASEDAARAGQINAYFRWETIEDTPTSFTMQLRLLSPQQLKSTFTFPTESTADLTLRRVQKFAVAPGAPCTWRLMRNGQTVAHGQTTPDAQALLTIPRLTISQTPATLHLAAHS